MRDRNNSGGIIGASTAAALTEMLGWVIADDFYRMSQGEEPGNIVESVSDLKGAFKIQSIEGLQNSNSRTYNSIISSSF